MACGARAALGGTARRITEGSWRKALRFSALVVQGKPALGRGRGDCQGEPFARPSSRLWSASRAKASRGAVEAWAVFGVQQLFGLDLLEHLVAGGGGQG